MFAGSTAQVITNRPDDEHDMVNWLRTEIGLGTSRDNLALHNRHRLGYERAIFADPDQALRVPVSRHHV